jgi:glycosyltransferase involved in cell wall biosynthesis
MKTVILHLSHTDIRSDSRILKELKALSQVDAFTIKAIGVDAFGKDGVESSDKFLDLVVLELISKRFTFLPKFLRHLFNLIELNLKLTFRVFKIRPHVIHCHDTTVLPVGTFLSILTNTKLVYDAHELESNRNGQSKLISYCVLLIERLCWYKVDHFISVSQSINDWYMSHFGYKNNSVILNSPEINVSSSSLNSIPSNYLHEYFKIDKNRKIFIYLGIVGKGRGIEKYLDVFERVDFGGDLVVVGYGEMIDDVILASTKCNRIHYHPPVKHNHVVELTKSADFGLCFVENVSLSDYYCLPNKLFEYAFSGLTVLGSNFPEISKIIDEYNLGYYCDPVSEDIFELVQKAISMPKPNFKDVHSLSWNTQSLKLMKLYETLRLN